MSASEASAPENNTKLVLSAIASAGFLLLFVLIIWLAYIPTHSSDINPTVRAKQEFKLVDLQATDTKKLNQYSVVNPSEGIYRIPIEKAMKLTVEQYRK